MVNKIKEYIEKTNENRIIQGISLFFIIYYAIVSLSMILSSTIVSMSNEYNQYNIMIESLSSVFYTHSSLIMVPLFLMFFLLFSKKLTLFYVGLSFVLSFGFNSYHFLDETIHPVLTSFGIYNSLLRDNQTILNPQYSKLILYILLILIMFTLSLIKKTRTLDRIFILLIALSVLLTTVIFHFALPMGMFKYIKNREEITLMENVKKLELKQVCDKKNCFIINQDKEIIENINNSDEVLLEKYNYYIDYVLSDDRDVPNDKKGFYRASLGDFRGLRFDYIITVVTPLFDESSLYYLVVMDKDVLKGYSRQSEIWFSYLTSVAHFIWIFGGVFLLFLHKRRFLKKRQ